MLVPPAPSTRAGMCGLCNQAVAIAERAERKLRESCGKMVCWAEKPQKIYGCRPSLLCEELTRPFE